MTLEGTMTREQLDQLETLSKAATPGLWMKKHAGSQDEIWSIERGLVAELPLFPQGSRAVDTNSTLIQDLRNNAAELIALAREALELREMLEYAFSDDVLEISGSRCYPVGYVAHIVTLDDVDHEGEGSTPLEAINNARAAARKEPAE